MYFVDFVWYKGHQDEYPHHRRKDIALQPPPKFRNTYKGTRECVCNVCMTVWKASADTSVFLHSNTKGVLLLRWVTINVLAPEFGCVRQCAF